MTRRPPFLVGTVDDYRKLPTEADMLAGLEQIVQLKGGRCWHIRDSRNCPETADLWDTTILLPGLLVAVELKSQRRPFESAGQAAVASVLATVERAVCGVVRPVPKPGELSYDEVLDLLRRA